VSDRRREVVRTGYDTLGDRYAAWAARIDDDPRDRFAAELTARLEPGADVLDLGCGSGIPTGALLAERFAVLGVDASHVQVERARREVPGATFVRADIAEIDFPPASFDAIVALYSLTHVPRETHAELFARIARWLRPAGLFLASLGARGSEDWLGEWLGVEMFFSSWDADTNRRLLREAGFESVLDEVVTMHEPGGPATFLWVLARKPRARGRSG
jgi:SAM-dependent methyltransferase